MKKVLIISPYFPPFNTADMQRVRMSLAYFKDFGWNAEVVKVADEYLDAVKDPLLLESIPEDQIIHEVAALPKKWTSKLGLGSMALRSLWYYRKKVNSLLNKDKYDLIYFSTTQFPVCILGAYWKKKFKVPYVIDMQDPWHSEYYQDKPKDQRPKKYWFSYRLNKFLEPIAMKKVDGLISVSAGYISMLQERYPALKNKPASVITFGAFEKDFEIAHRHQAELAKNQFLSPDHTNIVYIGRGGHDMADALKILFNAFKENLTVEPAFQQFRFHFIGTSYAPAGEGKPSIAPLAAELGLNDYVIEQTDRIPFYQTLFLLQQADALIIPGSDDPKYTASKIYPYILAKKPLLALFNANSAPYEMIRNCDAGFCAPLNENAKAAQVCQQFYTAVAENNNPHQTKWNEFEKYTAKEMTRQQCIVFENVINHVN